MGRLITHGAWLSHPTGDMKRTAQGCSFCGTGTPNASYLLEEFGRELTRNQKPPLPWRPASSSHPRKAGSSWVGFHHPEDQILGGPWIAAKIKRPIVEGGWLP